MFKTSLLKKVSSCYKLKLKQLHPFTGETIFSAPTDSGNSTHLQHHPTVSEVPLTKDPTSIAPSRPAPTALSTSGLLTTVTAAQLAAVGHHVAPATGGGPAGPTRQEAPSELNIGDEGEVLDSCCFKPSQLDFSSLNLQFLCFPPDPSGRRLRPTSPLDPLLAGLLSVFIVTTAFIFIVLFLRFRQRTNHPEFHRLQDLPMVRWPPHPFSQSVSHSVRVVCM